jgi:hypothetical protein
VDHVVPQALVTQLAVRLLVGVERGVDRPVTGRVRADLESEVVLT